MDNRPYIAVNPRMTAERNRSTIVHELAHMMFTWPEEIDEAVAEKKATEISGAFLFPRVDAVRELGIRRTAVTGDMMVTAQEYGISMYLLVKRAEICGIIGKNAEKSFYIWAGQRGWRTAEPSRISTEHPGLFRQLVCRAVGEDEISYQRGAELLGTSYDEIVSMCQICEG